MIRAAVFIAAMSVAMPAYGQGMSIESSTPRATSKDPNRKICERIEKIGSRLASTTVCRTAAEWEELRRGHRQDTEKVQQVVDQRPSGD